MKGTPQSVTRLLTPLLIALGLSSFGCASPRTVIEMHAVADSEHVFPEPSEGTVHPLLADSAREGQQTSRYHGDVLDQSHLSVEQRKLLSDVKAGLQAAGFTIVGRDEADYFMITHQRMISGEYDTYQRVPVYESTHATIHSPRGLRTVTGSTSGTVIVPQRRSYAYREVGLTAYPQESVGESAVFDSRGDSVVWQAWLTGDVRAVDNLAPSLVSRLLERWGASGRWEHVEQ